jgi:type II secretory pathway pseudopilin PulG
MSLRFKSGDCTASALRVGGCRCRRRGFTLVELLVIIACIGILFSLLLPALSTARSLANRTSCLNNVRQLGMGWQMYADDKGDYLVESFPGVASPNPYAWVLGPMNNISYGALSLSSVTHGNLYGYLDNPAIYRCPADAGVEVNGQKVPTSRSYSMNAFAGSRKRHGLPWTRTIPSAALGYQAYYEKFSDIPRPSQMWIFIEEDERTISDGFFTFDPEGRQYLNRLPAASAQRHNFGFALSFADGRCEIWRFSEPTAKMLSSGGSQSPSIINKDFEKLARVTASK